MKLLEKIDLDSIIEQNINLIDTGKFEEFYEICKAQLKRKDLILLTDLLSEEGIDLPYSITGFLYGVKTSSHTLSLRAPVSPTMYNVDFTSNQGMRGGHQIGFESRKAAQNYIDNFCSSFARVSIILPETVAGYTWKQIEIPGGIAFATTSAIQSFKPYMDPDQKKKDRLKTKYTNEIKKLNDDLANPTLSDDFRKLTYDENLDVVAKIKNELIYHMENASEDLFMDKEETLKQIKNVSIDYWLQRTISQAREDIELYIAVNCANKNAIKRLSRYLEKNLSNYKINVEEKWQTLGGGMLAGISIATPYLLDLNSKDSIKLRNKKQEKLELLKQKLTTL